MGRRRKKGTALAALGLGSVFNRQNINRVAQSVNNPVIGMLTAAGLTLLGHALGSEHSKRVMNINTTYGKMGVSRKRKLQPKAVDCGPGVEYFPPPRPSR